MAQAVHSAPWESRRGGRFGVNPDAPTRRKPIGSKGQHENKTTFISDVRVVPKTDIALTGLSPDRLFFGCTS